MTKLLKFDILAHKVRESRWALVCAHFWGTKTFITFELRKIEFSPLYDFYLFFEEESNGVFHFAFEQKKKFEKKN